MATALRSGGWTIGSTSWLIIAAGWAAMFFPTYWDLAGTIWRTDDQAHGVLILLVVAWLFFQQKEKIVAMPQQPRTAIGGVVFALGVLFYLVGRSQDILIFEIGSQMLVITGILLVMQGASAVRAAWFPLLYIVFMIPLPGVLVDMITGPLKQWISIIVENLLYTLGYPIARNGVVLTIGQYQLLVADACSGLHSMFSLSALGLLFMYFTGRKSMLHNGLMLASILPVAFAANVIRVTTLVLITYYFGDEAGQGFLHGFAGMVLIIAALLFLFLLDAVLARLIRN